MIPLTTRRQSSMVVVALSTLASIGAAPGCSGKPLETTAGSSRSRGDGGSSGVCGDGICDDNSENCASCARDCGRCGTVCGNANYAVPCGNGLCPSFSICSGSRSCECQPGYRWEECSRVTCDTLDGRCGWCVPSGSIPNQQDVVTQPEYPDVVTRYPDVLGAGVPLTGTWQCNNRGMPTFTDDGVNVFGVWDDAGPRNVRHELRGMRTDPERISGTITRIDRSQANCTVRVQFSIRFYTFNQYIYEQQPWNGCGLSGGGGLEQAICTRIR